MLRHAAKGNGVLCTGNGCGQGVLTILQGNLRENDHVILSLHSANDLTVDRQRHLCRIGVNAHIPFTGGTVTEAAAGDIDHRLLAPVCLIDIVGILFDFSVHGHKTLIVATLDAALVTHICGKVKHIPRMGRPQPGTGLKDLQHLMVVNGGIFLGIVMVEGLSRVP